MPYPNYSQPQPSSPAPASMEAPPPKRPHGCLVAFLGFLFVLSLLMSVALVNTRLTLFSPNFWKGWLDKSDAYERVQENLIPSIFSGFTQIEDSIASSSTLETDTVPAATNEAGPGIFTSPGYISAVAGLIQESVTPEWLELQSENAVDGFFRWTHGTDEELLIVFDLKPLQGKFTDGLIDIMEVEYNKLPVCSYAVEAEVIDFGSLTCRPPSIDFSYVREEFAKQNPDEIGYGFFPSEYVVDETAWAELWRSPEGEVATAPPFADLLMDPPYLYSVFNVAMVVSIILTALFAFFLIMIYRRDKAGMFKVLGVTLLIPGILAFASNLLLYIGSSFMVYQIFTWQTSVSTSSIYVSAMPAEQMAILNDFVLPLMSEFLRAAVIYQVIIWAVILGVAIVLMVLASHYRKRQLAAWYSQQPGAIPPPQ